MRRLLIPIFALVLLGSGCEDMSAQAPAPAAPQAVVPSKRTTEAATDSKPGAQGEVSARALVVPVVPANQPSVGPPTAKVTKVVDGDTIDVDIDGKADKVRFIGINAPELSSSDPTVLCLADAAKKALSDEIGTSGVVLESDATQYDRDKYERLLRYVVLPDGTDLNEWMVKEGFAYEYTYQVPYEKQAAYRADQKDAEANKRGLWGDMCAPTPAAAPAVVPAPTASGFTCAGKTTCGQMTSCEEARFYLTQCGVTRLDGDHDGTPCESICK